MVRGTGCKPGEEQSAASGGLVWWHSGAVRAAQAWRESRRGVLPLHWLTASLPLVPPCTSKEGVRQGRKAVRDGWLAVFLIMSLSSVFWSLNSVTNGLSCAKWLFRACKFGPCCMLPSGEELLPPPAVERGWAYLRLDDTNALQRFLSLDSGLWLVNLCHE